MTDLISYEIGVVASFKHCSESSVFYGDEFSNSKTFLTELFKKTSLVQVLFFSVLEKVKFDFTLDGDLNLLLDGKKYLGIHFVYCPRYFCNNVCLHMFDTMVSLNLVVAKISWVVT